MLYATIYACINTYGFYRLTRLDWRSVMCGRLPFFVFHAREIHFFHRLNAASLHTVIHIIHRMCAPNNKQLRLWRNFYSYFWIPLVEITTIVPFRTCYRAWKTNQTRNKRDYYIITGLPLQLNMDNRLVRLVGILCKEAYIFTVEKEKEILSYFQFISSVWAFVSYCVRICWIGIKSNQIDVNRKLIN